MMLRHPVLGSRTQSRTAKKTVAETMLSPRPNPVTCSHMQGCLSFKVSHAARFQRLGFILGEGPDSNGCSSAVHVSRMHPHCLKMPINWTVCTYSKPSFLELDASGQASCTKMSLSRHLKRCEL